MRRLLRDLCQNSRIPARPSQETSSGSRFRGGEEVLWQGAALQQHAALHLLHRQGGRARGALQGSVPQHPQSFWDGWVYVLLLRESLPRLRDEALLIISIVLYESAILYWFL